MTYQDLLKVNDRDTDRLEFVKRTINQFKASKEYKFMLDAEKYSKGLNATIMTYQKLLYTMSGKAVPDNFSANHKIASKFFYRFVTQENQFLLGNGITWNNPDAIDNKLGIDFDNRLQDMGWNALVYGVSYGFFNIDHLVVFNGLEFIPLYDEEDGSLKAGIRFWQIDSKKPCRATLYELDGYTDYIWNEENDITGRVLSDKKAYKLIGTTSPADGLKIYDGENYEGFPIVPMWANKLKQSKLTGLREQIDAYDLIKSGFCNDLDDCSQIFWCLSNCGGMDDYDLASFVERMKTIHAFSTSEDIKAEAHTIEVPYNARKELLDRLRNDLYEDAMALDTKSIVGGANTATQIKASYEPLNNEADAFEYCILDFLDSIMALAGIQGENPTFTRSYITNTVEEIQTIIQSATYLDEEYVTEKILTILGDADKIEDIKLRKDLESIERFNNLQQNINNQGENGV